MVHLKLIIPNDETTELENVSGLHPKADAVESDMNEGYRLFQTGKDFSFLSVISREKTV